MTGRTNVKEGNSTPGEPWHLYVWRNVTAISAQQMVCYTSSPMPKAGDLAIMNCSWPLRQNNFPIVSLIDQNPGSGTHSESFVRYTVIKENSDGNTLKTTSNEYYLNSETVWSRAADLDYTYIW